MIRPSLVWFCIWSGLLSLNAAELQLQISTYHDSNARELTTNPQATYGFSARGRLSDSFKLSRMSLRGEIIAHSYLDAIDFDENKVIFNGDLGIRYTLLSNLQIRGQIQHFLKSFWQTSYSYDWTSYSAALQYIHRSRYEVGFRYLRRYKLLQGVEDYRFVEDNLELNHRYHFTNRWLLEGSLIMTDLVHTDFDALEVVQDTVLRSMGIPQQDQGFGGLIHFRHRGNVIVGGRIGTRTVRSNSVIGDYELRLYQLYLSGNLGQSSYYHIIYRLVDKDYRYPQLEGISWYRDPEEHDQNLTHLRIEHTVRDNGLIYLQVSILRNETILNHRYFNKTMVEIGFKYDL